MTSMARIPRDFRTQYALPLTARDDEIVVDLFCGGGGAGTGLEIGLGRGISIAANHSPLAIRMHAANHPHAQHYLQDIRDLDPVAACAGRPVGWLHASPDCTHHSQARGGQPRSKEIRDLSWVVIRWAGTVCPRVISLENVKQILQWGPLIAKRDPATGRVVRLDGTVAAPGERVPRHEQFLVPDPARRGRTWRQFVATLEAMGYQVSWWVVRNCDYGDPTTRERLYMIARRDGVAPVKPGQTHFEKPQGGQQKWQTAADHIDWNNLGTSIFGRKKPLADATLRRISKGVEREVLGRAKPFIVPIANWSSERVQAVDRPLSAITAWPRGGAHAVVSPVLINAAHGEGRPGGVKRWGCGSRAVDMPLPTITASGSGGHAVATAFLAQMNAGFNTTHSRPADAPISAITRSGSQQQLVECVLSREHEAGALQVAAFLMHYYSEGGQWGAVDKPLNAITTRDRMALVTVWIEGDPYVIVDIRLRMLTPDELFACQGFPPNYLIKASRDGRPYTKKELTHLVGNSVSPGTMAAFAAANNPWRLDAMREAA